MDRDCNNCIYYKPVHGVPDTRSCSKWDCEFTPVSVIQRKAQILDSLDYLLDKEIAKLTDCDVVTKSQIDGLNIAKQVIEDAMKDVEGSCK